MNLRPKKYLGQHFLNDHNIARKIVSSLAADSKNVLEVGPGKGILTRYLLERDIDLKVIEIDKESVDFLLSEFPGIESRIIKGDFLAAEIGELFSGSFSIIGNFPYNISSQILFKALGYRDQVNEIVGMFQKEVADRIASPPGTKKYGILSVLMQAYYDIEELFNVSEHVFTPPPKVKSAVIRFHRNQKNRLDCDEKLFFRVVKTAFNQRRKTLRNSLGGLPFNKESMKEDIFSKRAEELTVSDFVRITQQLPPQS